jgi:GT2 family glycosyltransferase
MRIEIDMIIISYAKNAEFRKTTESCVKSIIASESSVKFNIFIVESNKAEKFNSLKSYNNVKVIHPTVPFGYHRYLNIGLKLGKSEYVCLCNNDLIFTKGWVTPLIEAMEKDPKLLSVSPYSTVPHKTKFNLSPENKIEYGYQIRRYLAGWCIFQKRKIYEQIGPLDELFVFWYADDDYSATLKQKGILHALVLNSIVEHVESKTLKTESAERRQKLTSDQKKIFENKWQR